MFLKDYTNGTANRRSNVTSIHESVPQNFVFKLTDRFPKRAETA